MCLERSYNGRKLWTLTFSDRLCGLITALAESAPRFFFDCFPTTADRLKLIRN